MNQTTIRSLPGEIRDRMRPYGTSAAPKMTSVDQNVKVFLHNGCPTADSKFPTGVFSKIRKSPKSSFNLARVIRKPPEHELSGRANS